MTTLQEVFGAARTERRAALIGYLPAGFPSVEGSIAAMTALVAAGCDVIEVGLPYSDPTMDGPTIQRAVDAALAHGTTTPDVLRVVEAVAATGTAALVMTYWNPVERYGVGRFVLELKAAGGAGVITPDLIPDEAADWLTAARAADLDTIFLVAPSSTDARLKMTAEHCRGFIYAASLMGVTGARTQVGAAAEALVRRIRSVTDLPIGVGLGVSTGQQAAEVASYADAVIVGSALVRQLLDAPTLDEGIEGLQRLTRELADGVRASAPAVSV
jgi:tryptophan synthase alpha chain